MPYLAKLKSLEADARAVFLAASTLRPKTYFDTNAIACFESKNDKSKWPISVRVHSHRLSHNVKIAKQTGNYLIWADSVEKFSADGKRLALTDAGDAIKEPNFAKAMEDAGVLGLFSSPEWMGGDAPVQG
uniref:Uncharacterized protein n=1 Tax=Plectus sambesii TaxID=2011161 RepID=A0A914UPG8_9BILA